MHPHDEPRTPATTSNPIHVVGAIAAKDLAAARSEALQPFHLSLAEADRNLRSLLPKKRTTNLGRPTARFTITDESPAFDHALAGPGSGPADLVPAPTFELRAPWYVDGADAVGQPA